MSPKIRRILLSLLGVGVVTATWFATRPAKPGPAEPVGGESRPDKGADAGEPAPPPVPKRIRPQQTEEEGEPPEISERTAKWAGEGKANPTAALGRILELEDGEERREAWDAVLTDWLDRDRESVLAWMKTVLHSQEGDIAVEITDVVIGTWAAEEPLPAMEWVTRGLQEPARTQALKTIAEVWSQADPDGMEAWVLLQGDPPAFWTGELIQGFIPGDPVRALEWCDRLNDPAQAEAARQNVIQSWQLNEPDEAAAYLKEHPALVPATTPE